MTITDVDWLVFTDLDGTMLNHHSYDMHAASGAVAHCRSMNIPVILNTSKTWMETVAIRESLGNRDPFIVENGSSIYLPAQEFMQPEDSSRLRDGCYEIVCGHSQQEISDVLDKLSLSPSSCVRLSQCSAAQAVELTGLSEEQAAQAIAREFSEPLLWQGDKEELQQLLTGLEQHGLTTLQGGRFLHVIGQCDKGRALRRVLDAYGGGVKCIALGDSPNDADMLRAADIAVIVRSPSSEALGKLVDAAVTTEHEAPEGWVEGVSSAMRRANINWSY